MMKRRNAAQGAARAKTEGCPSSDCVGIDLHVHSCFSDGVKTPAELAVMAHKAGVSYFALCDHDTASGYADMKKALDGSRITLIPGAEISTGQSGSTHVLCYGPKVNSVEMQLFLNSIAQERIGRAEEMMRRLAKEGIFIPEEKQAELLASSSVGRTHLARAIIETGACNTVRQAFDRYLGQGRPAYVPRKLPSTIEAVEKLSRMKVVTVLAHPMRTGLEDTALHAFIHSLKECGLMGLEAYHPSANTGNARALEALARQENLLVTGGSDYHGDPGSTAHIGRLPSGWQTRAQDMTALMDAISHMTHIKGANDHV